MKQTLAYNGPSSFGPPNAPFGESTTPSMVNSTTTNTSTTMVAPINGIFPPLAASFIDYVISMVASMPSQQPLVHEVGSQEPKYSPLNGR